MSWCRVREEEGGHVVGFNPPMHSLIRNGDEMQHTDGQFNPFRSIIGGSSLGGRAGKRKISWQDPVAF